MKYMIISFIFLMLIMVGCKKTPTEVYSLENNYMSLHVGDLRQCYMPYSASDTIYTLWKITGKTIRHDGQEVFISEWYTYNLAPQNKYYMYNFIRDGFYYGTKMDSTSTYPGNPYFEQKIAEINPNDGDSWIQTVGYYNPDSSQDHLTAKHLDEFDTPAGKFKDVYCFIGTRGTPNSEQGKIYYAKQYGYLGIAFTDSPADLFVVNYMKINGKEVGKYVDMSKSPAKKYYLASKLARFMNYDGSIIK